MFSTVLLPWWCNFWYFMTRAIVITINILCRYFKNFIIQIEKKCMFLNYSSFTFSPTNIFICLTIFATDWTVMVFTTTRATLVQSQSIPVPRWCKWPMLLVTWTSLVAFYFLQKMNLTKLERLLKAFTYVIYNKVSRCAGILSDE